MLRQAAHQPLPDLVQLPVGRQGGGLALPNREPIRSDPRLRVVCHNGYA